MSDVEQLARAILDMTSHVVGGDRWGDDHCIATDAELVADAVALIRKFVAETGGK